MGDCSAPALPSLGRLAAMTDCAFCDYAGPSEILADYRSSFVVRPIRPVTEGHVLVIPRRHVADFKESVSTFKIAAEGAVQWCRQAEINEANVITSRGWAATQTVTHLHLHVVPRRSSDRLALPWSSPDFGPLTRALGDFEDHGDYEGVVAAAQQLVRAWNR